MGAAFLQGSWRWVIGAVVVLAVGWGAHGQEAVKVVNLEKVNSSGDEEDPFPTPDGLAIFYARKGKGGYEIFQTSRASTAAAFGPGKSAMVAAGADLRSPYFYQGKAYFATNEIIDELLKVQKNFDIKWRIGTTAPQFVAGNVASKEDEMYPWIAAAGREFYFSRKTAEGWKLFVANGPAPGPIGGAMEAGLPVHFHRATVMPNGLVMFVQGPVGERLGLFRCKRAKIGAAWSEPEALKGLNHEEGKRGDMQPALSADGTRLYFVSDRPGGKGGLDLWVVPTAMLK